jgi:hypothetical protein
LPVKNFRDLSLTFLRKIKIKPSKLFKVRMQT